MVSANARNFSLYEMIFPSSDIRLISGIFAPLPQKADMIT
jgi:hypothetical protein